jgi:hypothetical protein
MSGSGGSYFTPSTPTSSCSTLQFDTQLASPKAQVIAQLSINDILDITFASTGHQVVIALFNGNEAGGIVDPHLSQLRNCMAQGEQYQARVLQITGGQVRLRVFHA